MVHRGMFRDADNGMGVRGLRVVYVEVVISATDRREWRAAHSVQNCVTSGRMSIDAGMDQRM